MIEAIGILGRPMKIAFVSIDIINNSGGVERSIINLANHYASRGHQVHILCLDRQRGKVFFHLEKEVRFHQPLVPKQLAARANLIHKIKQRFRCYLQNLQNLKGFLPHTLFLAQREKLRRNRKLPDFYRAEIVAVQEFLRGFPQDISMLHKCYLPYLFAVNDLQQAGSSHNWGKILTFLHEPAIEFQLLEEQGLNRYYNLYQLLNLSDVIGVNLDEHVAFFPAVIQPKVRVLALGSDYAPQMLNRTPMLQRRKQILFIGRIHPRKGVDLLLRAFRLAQTANSRAMSGWNLQVVGQLQDKGYARWLRQLAGPAVQFCGQVDDIKCEQLYCESAFFILPSLYEGLGLVIAEAMAFGLPCIGFADTPGVNTQIQDRQNGLLVNDCERIIGLKNAILELVSSAELREQLGQQALQDCQRYTKTVFLSRWDAILKDI